MNHCYQPIQIPGDRHLDRLVTYARELNRGVGRNVEDKSSFLVRHSTSELRVTLDKDSDTRYRFGILIDHRSFDLHGLGCGSILSRGLETRSGQGTEVRHIRTAKATRRIAPRLRWIDCP